MALPSNIGIKIPHRVKKGDVPKADDFNRLVDAIRALTQRGIEEPPRTVKTANPPFWTTIGGAFPDFTVRPTLGYLLYQNAGAEASTQGVTGYLVPFINGVSMEDPEVQPLALPDVASWVYLRVKTDADGVPKFSEVTPPVTIEAFNAVQESVHHVRPSPSGGEEEGDYFFLILQTESDGGTPEKPRAVRRLTGNRNLPNQLVEISNIGGEHEIYKGYAPGADDKHEFRSLEQLAGAGEELIKGTPPGTGDTIPFRRIAQRATSPQVKVGQISDDIIKVEGNGYDSTESDVRKFSISVVDGLVTSLLKDATDGWWGTVEIEWFPAGGGSPSDIAMTFEAGILMGVSFTGAAQTGTEGSPGSAYLSIMS